MDTGEALERCRGAAVSFASAAWRWRWRSRRSRRSCPRRSPWARRIDRRGAIASGARPAPSRWTPATPRRGTRVRWRTIHPSARRVCLVPRALSPRTAAGARARGHVTRGGSGREGLGASPPRLRRRLLGVDVDAAEAEAAGEPSLLLWPALGDIPLGLRCSACELTLRAVHAEAVSAARRLRPPSWLAASPQTRETLVGANWNRACGVLAADDATRVVGDTFTAGESYAEDAWARAEEKVAGTTSGTTSGPTSGTTSKTSADANSPSSLANATRGIISACALLRLDARAKLHLTGMVTTAGIHPFGAVEVREACVLVAGDATCRDRRGGEARSEL